jgi:hypothetical protein
MFLSLMKVKTYLLEFKDFILTALGAALVVFAYFKGRESVKIKQAEGELNAVQKAKQARDSLNNPARVKQLHDKYKR